MILRDYQQKGVKFLIEKGRAILADVMGTGKTCQALVAAKTLGVHSILIVSPKSVETVWISEAIKWFPELQIYQYSGHKTKRQKMLQLFRASTGPKALLTHYELLEEIVQERYFELIIGDEAHRLRNRKTMTFQMFAKLRSDYLFLLTGTPIISHPVDIIPLIMLIQQRRNYWDLVSRFFPLCQNEWGGKILGGVRDLTEFKNFLKEYVLRRTKDFLGLPAKVRQRIDLKLTPRQKSLYNELKDQLKIITEEGILFTPSVLALITRLRQILASPALLGFHDPGASRLWLREFVQEMQDINEPVVIFLSFSELIPYLVKDLQSLGLRVAVLRGGMTKNQFDINLNLFQNGSADVIIVSIRLAEGFSLVRSHIGVFLNSDWSAAANVQAEDRLHRSGQLSPVVFYYLSYPETVEDRVFEVIQEKFNYARTFLEPKGGSLGENI